MKKQAILIALIILSSLSLSAKDIVVINSENGKPLVGATVFGDKSTIVSDRFGKLSKSEISFVVFVSYNSIHLNSTLQNDTLIVDFPFTLDSPRKLGKLKGTVKAELNNHKIARYVFLEKDGFTYIDSSEYMGEYIFENLSEGKWEIKVDSNLNFLPYRKQLLIDTNNTLTHDIILEDNSYRYCSLEIEVLDESGNPFKGAFVNLKGKNISKSVDDEGKAIFEKLLPNTYSIRVETNYLYHEIDTVIETKNNTNYSLTIQLKAKDRKSKEEIELSKREILVVEDMLTSNYISTSISCHIPPDIEPLESKSITLLENNDYKTWNILSDFSIKELSSFTEDWGIKPTNRYTVQLTSIDNRPVIDAKVNLINQVGKVIWSARSDNTGKAELWADAYREIDDNTSGLAVEVLYKEKRIYQQNITTFNDGINFIQVDEYCTQPNKVDILFAIDATGSMGDRIEYLNSELEEMVSNLIKNNSEIDLRVGSVFYRDYFFPKDELVNTHNFTKDIFSLNDFLGSQESICNFNTHQAVDVALSSAVNEFSWSENARARIMFLKTDTKPHKHEKYLKRFRELTAKASEMGIRVVPIIVDDIDKSGEFVYRSTALLTNGSFFYFYGDTITDNCYREPTTDSYDVEMMNEMIVRIINQFIDVPKCESDEIEYANKIEDKIYNKQETINQDISEFIKVYRNPTDGPLTLSLQEEYDNLFVVDMNGKILFKVEAVQGDIQVNLSNFPSGAYFLKYSKDGAWGSTQLQLIR
ncbi:MAG: T9SS type A sorting domain-containing protein [Chlorobiota bacterium]